MNTDKFILCECGGEAILFRNDEYYSEIDLAIYTIGQFNKKPSLFDRLKYCWYHLITGKKYEDQITISYDKAKELSDWIIDQIKLN